MFGSLTEWTTFLRKLSYDEIRNNLLVYTIEIVNLSWRLEAKERRSITAIELKELTLSVATGKFQFYPMYRSWIPKAKAGSFRPITQPDERDTLLMDGIASTLNLAYQNRFLGLSHGFRKGRGSLTFFSDLHSWGRLNRIIKADVVKCFDNINHDLLISFLITDLGAVNQNFIELILSFMKCQIRDQEQKDYTNTKKGIPQGSSLSPVLMNIYLHRLDLIMERLMSQESNLKYIRYADDMIIGFQLRNDVNNDIEMIGVLQRFLEVFAEGTNSLNLQTTSIVLHRNKPGKTRILGLNTYLKGNGKIVMYAPLKRWKKKLTLDYLISKMDVNNHNSLQEFIKVVRRSIQTRIAFSLCSIKLRNETTMLKYLISLSNKRIREFICRSNLPLNPFRAYIYKLNSFIPSWATQFKAKIRTRCSLPVDSKSIKGN